MATIGGDWPTLLDVSKRTDPDGKIGDIVEMLQQQNPILMDAPFYEGNLPTGHQVTQRTGLPAVFYRRINQGVPRSKSTTAQVTVTAANLEALSQIDERLAKLNGIKSAWAMSEEMSFVEAMNQQIAATMFYGSEVTVPEEFTGFAIQYSSLSANSGENILDAGGTGTDNTSMWLVTWAQNNASYMFYPKGAAGSLNQEDKGLLPVQDDSSNTYFAWTSQWIWQLGLCIADWQANVRIANIDTSNLFAESSAADLLKLMTKAYYKIPQRIVGRRVFYATRGVMAMLHIQAAQKSNVYLTAGEEEGRPKVSFLGIPIRAVDQLLETESRVT